VRRKRKKIKRTMLTWPQKVKKKAVIVGEGEVQSLSCPSKSQKMSKKLSKLRS